MTLSDWLSYLVGYKWYSTSASKRQNDGCWIANWLPVSKELRKLENWNKTNCLNSGTEQSKNRKSACLVALLLSKCLNWTVKSLVFTISCWRFILLALVFVLCHSLGFCLTKGQCSCRGRLLLVVDVHWKSSWPQNTTAVTCWLGATECSMNIVFQWVIWHDWHFFHLGLSPKWKKMSIMPYNY